MTIRWGGEGEMWLRKGIQGEMTRIEGHLRDYMKTQFSHGNFLKYMKMILTKSSKTEEGRVPTGHLFSAKFTVLGL